MLRSGVLLCARRQCTEINAISVFRQNLLCHPLFDCAEAAVAHSLHTNGTHHNDSNYLKCWGWIHYGKEA